MSFFRNIVFGFLATVSCVLLVSIFGDFLYPLKMLGIPVYFAPDPQAVADKEVRSLGALMRDVTEKDMAKVARRCTSCHTYLAGQPDRVGPNLFNIVGSNIGKKDNFNYSSALKSLAKNQWTYENLNAWLENPKNYAPGTKMAFAGFRKPEQRAAMIMYLRQLSDSPMMLPDP